MDKANEKFFGKVNSSAVGKVKWWTGELDGMRKEVRRLRRKVQKGKVKGKVYVPGVEDEYKNKMRDYKRRIKNVKDKHWKEFVRDKGNRDPWGEVYRMCKGRKTRNLMCAVKDGNRMTVGWVDTVRVMMNEFFSGSDTVYEYGGDSSVVGTEFEWNEIESAVKGMRMGKAPGLDGVTADMLLRVWYAIPVQMKLLYDECLVTSTFPSEWKRGEVVILLKSVDKVRTDVRSYRPVCLLSTLVLERLLVARLEILLRAGVGMSDRQYGFRKGRSTDDAWMEAKRCVSESRKKYVLGVFVDFQGAFDNLE